jgi:uncharacterized protein YcbX
MPGVEPSLGRVAELYRFPVKSLSGERLRQVQVDERGVVGDRLWSVRDPDGRFGSGKTTRRFRRMDGLLALRASYDGETPVVTFPDGRSLRGDEDEVHESLSRHVGRPVHLAHEERVSHFDDGPIHFVTTASLRHVAAVHGAPVDALRLRPNLVIDTELEGCPEQQWLGRRLALGPEVVLHVVAPMPRCVMLDLPQAHLPADRRLLRTVMQAYDGDLGVLADVVRPGNLSIGDTVAIDRRPPG